MGKYQRFDEVPVWQEAAHLYQRVLDLVEEANVPLTSTFRSQLERAALRVSNSVAEGYECMRRDDLLSMLGVARCAAAEVQSMIGVIHDRPKAARLREPLQGIRASAESCARQLGAWRNAIENPALKRPNAEEVSARPSAEKQVPGVANRNVTATRPNPSAPAARGK